MGNGNDSEQFSGPRLEIKGKGAFPIIDRCTIGRHPNNSVCVDHKKISRWHAAIVRLSDREFRLMDFDTVNGTWLNQRRISDPSILSDGDQMRIGPLELTFRNNSGKPGTTQKDLGTTILDSYLPPDFDDADFEATGHGIVALDKTCKVRAVTEAARQWIKHFYEPSWTKEQPVPNDILKWLQTGLAQLNSPDSGLGIRPLRKKHGKNRLSFHLKADQDQQEILLLMVHEEPLFDQESLIEEFGREFQLTAREAEILYYLALGKTNPEIGTITECSNRTVEAHLRKVFPKLNVENRQAAAVFVPEHFRNKHRRKAESETG